MRTRWPLFLLMLLLPLRLWAGQVMPTLHAAAGAGPTSPDAGGVALVVVDAPCHGTVDDSADASAHTDTGAQCTHCPLCHAGALPLAWQVQADAYRPDTQMVLRTRTLASAELLPAYKPPIS